MRDIEGKVAFITGAASGMGLGMTKASTRAGMKVMMADIDAKRLQAAASDLKARGADVDTLRCDITIEDSVFAAADATVKRFGTVNVLCNNAGVRKIQGVKSLVVAFDPGSAGCATRAGACL